MARGRRSGSCLESLLINMFLLNLLSRLWGGIAHDRLGGSLSLTQDQAGAPSRVQAVALLSPPPSAVPSLPPLTGPRPPRPHPPYTAPIPPTPPPNARGMSESRTQSNEEGSAARPSHAVSKWLVRTTTTLMSRQPSRCVQF
ncbi:hypothetical protein B0H11DRAFT_1927127 [Mycena galericulata]|nr:hypothetical protein B0H11DRAFT_1927127 [Mycena galericulata]